VIYLYAIGERDGALTAFVRRGRGEAPGEAALIEHDRIVSSLMEDGAVLPVRFGTVLPGEADVRELLAWRGEELRGQLAHVRGRVEMGVRAPWDGGPIVANSGGEFMRAKAERRAAARRAAATVHEPLSELAVDSVLRLNPREDTMFSAAYLVAREQAGEFADRARRLAAVTGPWPPYSFSG
jgi:hypothetical protein